jgi:orotidine-5'-phosphate decarboxylase
MMIGGTRVKLFIDNLIDAIQRKNSNICIGLDPHQDLLPPYLLEIAKNSNSSKEVAISMAICNFNKKIIDYIADLAIAVKPQIAFYEELGASGMIALKETIKYAKEKELIVILDAKRNDIGSTVKAYARAYFSKDSYNTDALTINPYLGIDGVKPFLEEQTKGAFVLVRTSNPSAVDIQDLKLLDGIKLYEKIGELVSYWGSDLIGSYSYSNLGAVIGATYPTELKKLREIMPHTYFLIPGYGAQGGEAKDVIEGLNNDGLGAIINSSRSIIFAYKERDYSEEEFAMAARDAACEMRDNINKLL